MAEDFGSGVSRTLSATDRSFITVCSVCGTGVSLGRKFCSHRCMGAGQRQESEAKYNLSAFTEWSFDMAYAFGLFISDGDIGEPARGSRKVNFNNTDLETVLWWHSFLGNPTKVYHIQRHPPHKDIFRSTATSDTLANRLIELGAVPRKSTQDIGMPHVPAGFLAGFMRGFLDGDGGVGMHRNPGMKGGFNLVVNLTANPVRFRQGLADVLRAKGMNPSENRITLKVAGSDAERFCQWVYATGGPAMAHKKKVWERWQDFRRDHGGLISESDPHEFLRGLRIEPWHSRVGMLSDTHIAKEVGMSKSRVGQVRKALGIPKFKPPTSTPEPRPWHSLAGNMTDVRVSEIGGVSKAMVCTYRKRMLIPRYRPLRIEEVV